MILPRITLLHTPSASTSSQTQHQTPPSSSPPESWSLPVSYRVAIFLNFSILIFIFAIVLGLLLYIRNRRPTAHQLLLQASHRSHSSRIHDEEDEEEEENLLESKDAYSDSDLNSASMSRSGEGEVNTGSGEMTQKKKRPGPIHVPMPGTFSPVGILSPSIRTPGSGRDGEKRKRGHVRWTPSVQGGEVFGILEESAKGKDKETEEEEKEEKVEKKSNCRGKRHPGCWRFELHFEDGARPVLGEEREEGLGRPSR